MTGDPTSLRADLTDCDREPIHIPGSIQPHGVLIAIDEGALIVMQISENVIDHLGVAAEAGLARPLADVLDSAVIDGIREALAADDGARGSAVRVRIASGQYDVTAHRHEGATIIELERISSEADETRADRLLLPALMGIQSADSLAELADTVVREVRRLTGFERVMLYRFSDEGHGSVEAEVTEPELDSYLGLRYPASDIPRQARALYAKNWLRIIPDARYTPAKIVPMLRPDTDAPLDLSFANLRSVSPIHLEYLGNMGVRASMSISLLVRGQLWGLISCINHSGPRHVDFRRRSACEVLGRLTSLQIAALEEHEAAAQRLARRATQRVLRDAMSTSPSTGDVLEGLVATPAETLSLVQADGAALVCAGRVVSCGRVPDDGTIERMAAGLDVHAGRETFATRSLASLLPEMAAVSEVAAGVLTFTLPGDPVRRLLWFRSEIVRTVDWGGDPRKPVTADAGARLHPRRSFALWKEEVHLQSAAWTPSDLEAADDLRRHAVEIDLERQVVRQRQAVQVRDDLLAVVSHDLRNPLSVIQMQAALLLNAAGSTETEGMRRVRASAERVQRSVERMESLIHNLLDLAKIEAGRFSIETRIESLSDLLNEAMLILRPLAEQKGITVVEHFGVETRVVADRDRIFQVLSNLMGNAVKFTPKGRAIEVRALERPDDVVVSVCDTGPGIAADQQPYIFERYWRARATGNVPEGSGLGLFVVKGIVEAHGGRVWADGTEGSGAALHFTLPKA